VRQHRTGGRFGPPTTCTPGVAIITTFSASPSKAAESSRLTDGFHLVVDSLKADDVDTIYGIVGIPITGPARIAQSSGIRYIGFRQETSAGNAAAAAGFLTQRPGVCLTTSGPGFLNGVPALANGTTNCFPMIQISGSSNRATVDLQRGDYQDLDQLSAARPFVKAACRIGRIEDIGRGVARAIRLPGSCQHPRRSIAHWACLRRRSDR